MDIQEFNFTKNWTNPTDFPTYEESEERVRQDQQYLFDEIKKFINGTLIPKLKEGALPPGGTEGQTIVKQSDDEGDAAWGTVTPPALKAFSVFESERTTTVVNTFADGSTETIVISFNENGKPVGMTIDGTVVPGAWTEV